MTTYNDILAAADAPEYDDAIRQIKRLAAKALHEADDDVRLLSTEHFNHSYLPDFVMRWRNRQDRFVYLRASAYAEEIEEDVVRLTDHNPIFVQLSEFVPYNDRPIRQAIDSLSQSAGARKSLIASVPAIGLLDDAPRTGKMLSSFVMRGGRGVIEDSEVVTLAQTVESGFDGAMHSDREKTADAIQAVETVLDPASTVEFTHLFEAAWISGGASGVEFPGGLTSIGDNLTADLLGQMLEIVPESLSDFWEQIGNAVTLESFSQLHLVGSQPRLQSIMKNAISRLASNRYMMRRTQRSDQEVDPFIWQIDSGTLSLRGAGYQAWIGAPALNATENATDEDFAVDLPPTLSNLSMRAEEAQLTISDIGVSDTDGITVRFTSPGQGDVATSDLVERVTETVGNLVRVNEVVALVEGKRVPVDYNRGVAGPRTSSRVSVSGLIWNGWNLLAETDDEVRETLAQVLNRNGEPDRSEDAGDVLSDVDPSPDPVADEGSKSV
ncbi:hypothetical protein [Mycolicibacterium fluoranthenivorans]|uniref:Uncharacterized protein n=1 Tax=Mycolicibacterium fluoranthenivorans TaxID=258505 RepID=A0A7X5U4R9_9MYCO|nr:hypothetical protein [Mycolicibacterium fluoranthenivorans]MCV7355939.1 hypothetical protein [Mycolicibacterium fluoranthenivorans]NIH98409.1 hypothetical protein [Mycolicibacterium fluoranthenivorans]